jgi:hypothetical protein
MTAFVKNFIENYPNKLGTFLHSDFLKNANQINLGINALKPINPNLSEEQQKQQKMKNVAVGTLASAAINFLPKLAGFLKGGKVLRPKKTKAKKKPKTKAKKKPQTKAKKKK